MENQFIKYLDIRQPSKYKTYEEIQKIPNHRKAKSDGYNEERIGRLFYSLHKCDAELTEELKILFPDLIDTSDILLCNYQCIYNGLPIHNDNRDVAFNFIIEPGGDNAETVWYDDNYKEIHRECIEAKKWHQFNTNALHSVEGITNKRFGITITSA